MNWLTVLSLYFSVGGLHSTLGVAGSAVGGREFAAVSVDAKEHSFFAENSGEYHVLGRREVTASPQKNILGSPWAAHVGQKWANKNDPGNTNKNSATEYSYSLIGLPGVDGSEQTAVKGESGGAAAGDSRLGVGDLSEKKQEGQSLVLLDDPLYPLLFLPKAPRVLGAKVFVVGLLFLLLSVWISYERDESVTGGPAHVLARFASLDREDIASIASTLLAFLGIICLFSAVYRHFSSVRDQQNWIRRAEEGIDATWRLHRNREHILGRHGKSQLAFADAVEVQEDLRNEGEQMPMESKM
ncbi:hypothetical protein, conserved [Eimeria tenella]|uniref:Uncharacterized protein n=1 Tax=Eimeria tenella TaxID=5802 RepID=U6KML3_EIMTE|nr:hypothetical protein, conserved [Eimeria tenella]CDJ37512.1 hypothetical protein, conserved [Eimeria tenella]|eukprot:XP_013228350.1 hypothetical protein, conserved [Eimeria tenella]